MDNSRLSIGSERAPTTLFPDYHHYSAAPALVNDTYDRRVLYVSERPQIHLDHASRYPTDNIARTAHNAFRKVAIMRIAKEREKDAITDVIIDETMELYAEHLEELRSRRLSNRLVKAADIWGLAA